MPPLLPTQRPLTPASYATKPGLRSAVPGAAYGSVPDNGSSGGNVTPPTSDPNEVTLMADEDSAAILDEDDNAIEVD